MKVHIREKCLGACGEWIAVSGAVGGHTKGISIESANRSLLPSPIVGSSTEARVTGWLLIAATNIFNQYCRRRLPMVNAD